MSRTELLRAARTAYVVSWAAFQKNYNTHKNSLYCFFEGEDIKYYGIRIDMLIPNCNHIDLNCGGRDGVLRLRTLVRGDEQYAAAWAAFFIDADFNPPDADTSHPDIYTTPCYSIENLYTSNTAFSRLIKGEVLQPGAHTDEDDLLALEELYTQGITSFLDATERLNGWIFWHRRNRPNEAKPRLKEVPLKNLVHFEATGSVSTYSDADLDRHFNIDNATPPGAIDEALQILSANPNRAASFRGKYILSFYEKLIRHIVESTQSKALKYIATKRSSRLTIQEGNSLSQLCQYADTPHCLTAFLAEVSKRSPSHATG